MDIEIKERNSFRNLTYDDTFKFIFSKKHLLIDFLNSYFKFLNIKKSVNDVKVNCEQVLIPKMVGKRDFYLDVIALLEDGEIYDIEIYREFNLDSYLKSYSYACRIYSNQITKDIVYKDAKKVTSFNLMTGNFKRCNEELINVYNMQNKNNHYALTNQEIEMVLVRLDKVESLDYHNDEDRFIRWLKLINAGSIEEMKNIAKGDEAMEQSARYIDRFFSEGLGTTFEEYLNFMRSQEARKAAKEAKKATREAAKEAKKEGRAEGIAQGKIEGIAQGIAEGKIQGISLGKIEGKAEDALNMLKDNLDINTIAKYTSLTIEEISDLKNKMKNNCY